jgi:integrase
MNAQRINKTRSRRNTFSVTFFIDRRDITRKGTCVVRGRITVDTVPASFSTKTKVPVDMWNAERGMACGKSREALAVNKTIGRLREEIGRYHRECIDRYGYVTAESIRNRIDGSGQNQQTLLALFGEHNDEFEKRVGVDRGQPAMDAYLRTYKRLERFIKKRYAGEGLEDIGLKRLDREFIEEFHLYLMDECSLGEKIIQDSIIHLRKMSKRARNQGGIVTDPFADYRVKQTRSPFRHLKEDEMIRIMEARIDDPKVACTRDLFVFSCFTGLAFVDVCALSEEHVVRGPDGGKWVRIKRGKTGVESNFKLLKIPLAIMERYDGQRKGAKIFNIEYKHRDSIIPHMRELERICGIEHVTYHMSRHNFATHVTLSQGIPITSVQKMMGHTSVRTTQIYAQMQEAKLNSDIKGLTERTKGKYKLSDHDPRP